MSNPAKKPKLSGNGKILTNGSGSNGVASKLSIIGNKILDDVDFQEKLKNKWKNNEVLKDDNLRLDPVPFRHGELLNFVEERGFLDDFVKKLKSFELKEKASDLFQFKQSNDLKSFVDVDPHAYKIMEFLSSKALPFLKLITGIPLNDKIDLFLSEYRQTDFLLCHDDELDSRRIAFILYLSDEWKTDFGGNLDLYSSKDFHPEDVVKSITPEFNKFVFFEVGATSFHQVSEVLHPEACRLALSGWFYGEPLPRPKIEIPFPEGYILKDSVIKTKGIFKQLCNKSYLDTVTQTDINEQLAEESEVLVPGFLLDNVYSSICKDIVNEDVERSLFQPVGSPNIASYHETNIGPPKFQDNTVENITLPHTFSTLQELFHSEEFLEFMEKVTEYPFTSCDITRVSSSLKKFTHGSFSLLRSGGAKQTGNKEIQKDNQDTEDLEEEDEEEEEPQLVDVAFYFASKWEDEWGGLKIYSAEDGEQLISVSPEGNCLAVVVRNSTVNSYVNYVNCLAKDQVYFVYNLTFAFDGNLIV